MKTLFGTLAIAFAATLFMPATTFANDGVYVVNEDNRKEEIKASDLPANIQEDIKANWPSATISKAFKIVDEAGKVTGYEAVVSADGAETTVAYDAEGKRLK